MPRIVALDVGDATIGVAATDELGLVAAPVRTVYRTKSIKADLRAVVDLLTELGASEVVVGNPIDVSGAEGAQSAKVREFADRLAARLRIPLVFVDESYTTAEAEDEMIAMNVSRAKRRRKIDSAAAVLILESYMRQQ